MFIEDDPEDLPSRDPCFPLSMTVSDLLLSCALESKRQAHSMKSLDLLVGDLLLKGSAAANPLALQKLDLLRQESDGLARVLELLARQADPKEPLDTEKVASCLSLSLQRDRICMRTNNRR
jgi:hypothetical protein